MSKAHGLFPAVSALLFLIVVASLPAGAAGEQAPPPPAAEVDGSAPSGSVPGDYEYAIFAGGCFWCMEEAYEKVPGVAEVVSGYAGGEEPNPEYRAVASGQTGHREVVRVAYDPQIVSYEELLHVFWRNVDPTDDGGQFCDRGVAYLTGIFYQTDEQRRMAEESRQELERSGRFQRPIVTKTLQLKVIAGGDHDGFWLAEEYHQDYYTKNPLQYRFYKEGCGRVRRLEQLWGDEAGAPEFQKGDA